MAEKQTSKDRMREIVDSIENGIKELFESDKYRQYLSTMSRFHRYSVNNTMLIYMQRPDATHVAGFNKWRDQFGRNVLKGEKGIRIIAPTPYKKKVEEIKTDPETNAPILDADGKAIIEEKEIRIPMFKVVSVFDVSQTAGKPLPQLAADLSGNVQQYEVFMEALRRALHALDTAHLGEKARADACRALREHEMAALREAADELDGWLAWACRSRIPRFVELSRKVRRKRRGILRSIELGVSNARVEAVNNKIKVAIRQGYGFRNIDNLIALVMLRCSDLKPALPGREA